MPPCVFPFNKSVHLPHNHHLLSQDFPPVVPGLGLELVLVQEQAPVLVPDKLALVPDMLSVAVVVAPRSQPVMPLQRRPLV